MENASKALLIAGAILLVIAIIAIGVGIVSKTRETIYTAGNQIDAMEVQMHNKQFEGYEGIGKNQKEAKDLISTIIINNKNASNDDRMVTVYYGFHGKNTAYNSYSVDWVSPNNNLKDPDDIANQNGYFNGEVSARSWLDTSNYNTGTTFNIKFEYNSQGLINKIYFYRWFN